MDVNLTRRDLVARGLPAVLAGGAFATAAFAQEAPATNRQPGQTDDAQPADGQAHDGQAPGGIIAAKLAEAYVDGKYILPQLPYAYDALEPHIDATTMQIHHSRHQQGYVNGLNTAVERMREITNNGQVADAELGELQRDLSFNGGGHLNHTIFFAGMSPDGGGEPKGQIAQAINDTFGSFQSFKAYFSKAAGGVKGSGWGVLAYEPLGDNLLVFSMGDQDLRQVTGTTMLLGVDVWEHAYYLNYQNRRADYIAAWWNTVNWTAVDQWYQYLRSMTGR